MEIVALIVVGLIVFWLLGGFVLRIAGLLMIALALFSFILGTASMGNTSTALTVLVAGVALWLVGHWHFAMRHREYKSRLAAAVLEPLSARSAMVFLRLAAWAGSIVRYRPGFSRSHGVEPSSAPFAVMEDDLPSIELDDGRDQERRPAGPSEGWPWSPLGRRRGSH